MTRLIDADALRDALIKKSEFRLDPETHMAVRTLKINISEAIRMVNEQSTVNQWISCSERLPSNVGLYLTTVKCYNINNKWEGDVTTISCHYSHVKKWIGVEQTDVIAWMPLPKPYEEE